jgi:metallo-beta-lactamase family protein
MEIEFVGAAREVTGSCHIVRANGKTVMLDCGMFQGKRSEADEKNRRLPIPIGELDAIILSHAHLDHCGRLPLLAKAGYSGPIHCTKATADLTAIMLAALGRKDYKDAIGRELPFSRIAGHDVDKAVTQGIEWVCDRSVSFMGAWR